MVPAATLGFLLRGESLHQHINWMAASLHTETISNDLYLPTFLQNNPQMGLTCITLIFSKYFLCGCDFSYLTGTDIHRLQIKSTTADTDLLLQKSSIFWDTMPCSPLLALFFNTGFLLGLLFDPKDGGNMFL
jgi:hypothetical protein